MPKYQYDWENPEIFQINTLAPHATASHYPDRASALNAAASPWEASLNGDWAFNWSPNPDARPKDFYQPNFDASGWKTIPAPSNWEMHGYSRPNYINVGPRPGLGKKHIPQIDHSRNQVGCYRRTFTLPDEWEGMRFFIRFDGVRSAFYLYLNGQKIGYSQGSATPAEFELTEHLQAGENLLAAEVYSLCDGTYLEDQDMWRLSGIYRDVTLWAAPVLHLRDFYLKAELDSDYRDAVLHIRAEVNHQEAAQPHRYSLRVSLLDKGRSPSAEPLILHGAAHPAGDQSLGLVSGEMLVTNPEKWTAESPTLYTVLLELLDENGQTIEAVAHPFGFRSIEIREKQILVNGKPVIFKGINRHEMDPIHGQAIPKERFEADLRLIKQTNINAVRTAHYPNQPYFYQLCDRLGLYVMDEANLETHGVAKKVPASKPEWRAASVNRMERMVARDRNHTCVMFWSLGNEAGHGENFAHMKRAALELDPTRPIHYEGDHFLAVSEVISTMYPPPHRLEAIARADTTLRFTDAESPFGTRVPPSAYRNAPILVCEYTHAMGNSVSMLAEHMRIFETYPHAAGGFIWDFADQGLQKETGDGTPFLAYGGDFGDMPNDGYFCMNGIFNANRQPHPAAFEVKKVYQPIGVTAGDLSKGEIIVHNKQWFTSLSAYILHWEILENGFPLQEGHLLPLTTPPGESETLRLPYQLPDSPGAELHLNVHFLLAEDTVWAEKGFEVAWEQLSISQADLTQPPSSQEDFPPVNLQAKIETIQLSTQSGSVGFDTEDLSLISLTIGTEPLLAHPLLPNFWRAPVDNDVLAKMWLPFLNPILSLSKYWKHATEKRKLIDFHLEQMVDGSVDISVQYKIPYGKTPLSLDYTIHPSGDVDVRYRFTPKKQLMRAGIAFEIPAAYQHVTYFGFGPHETMRDRQTSGKAGIYQATVEELIHDYPHPQENGNRSRVRWVRFLDDLGKGLEIATLGEPLLNFSAWPYTQEDLATTSHPHKLPRRSTITVNIGSDQKGVGDLFSFLQGWPPEALLPAGQEYAFGFSMRPVK